MTTSSFNTAQNFNNFLRNLQIEVNTETINANTGNIENINADTINANTLNVDTQVVIGQALSRLECYDGATIQNNIYTNKFVPIGNRLVQQDGIVRSVYYAQLPNNEYRIICLVYNDLLTKTQVAGRVYNELGALVSTGTFYTPISSAFSSNYGNVKISNLSFLLDYNSALNQYRALRFDITTETFILDTIAGNPSGEFEEIVYINEPFLPNRILSNPTLASLIWYSKDSNITTDDIDTNSILSNEYKFKLSDNTLLNMKVTSDNSGNLLIYNDEGPDYKIINRIDGIVKSELSENGLLVNGNISADSYSNLPTASVSVSGIVQLNDSVNSTSTSQAGTANAVKQAYDLANSKVNKSGDTITGNLTINSTLYANTYSNLPNASTSISGIVQLNDSVNSTSTTQAGTANAVKQAYDLANTANSSVSNKVNKTGDTMTGALTVLSTLYADTYQNLPLSSETSVGVVQLSNDYTSTSTTTAPSSKTLANYSTFVNQQIEQQLQPLSRANEIQIPQNWNWTIGTGGDFSDLQTALASSNVRDGHILRILSNTNIDISTTLTITKQVVIFGENRDTCIIRNAPAVTNLTTLLNVQADYVMFSNLTINFTSSISDNFALNFSNSSGDVVNNPIVNRCRIVYNKFGIVLRSRNGIISNCLFETQGTATTRRAISIYRSVGNCFVYKNTFNQTIDTANRLIHILETSVNDIKTGTINLIGNTSTGVCIQFVNVESFRGITDGLTYIIKDNVMNESNAFVVLFGGSTVNAYNTIKDVFILNNTFTNRHTTSPFGGKGCLALDLSVVGRSSSLPVYAFNNVATIDQFYRAGWGLAANATGVQVGITTAGASAYTTAGYNPVLFSNTNISALNLPSIPTEFNSDENKLLLLQNRVDAINLSNYVLKTGDTMTGALTVSSTLYANTYSNLPSASTSVSGIVQLNDTINSTSTTQAGTANAVKQAYDLANTANTLASGKVSKTGDTMTGALTVSSTLYANTYSNLPQSSTSISGIVQLNDTINSTSTTQAGTANAVKQAYDLANTANTLASGKVSKTGDTMTGALTVSSTLYANTYSNLPQSSTSISGIVQLNDTINSTSTTQAGTANAVKQAYDLANTANTLASGKVSKTGDTMTGALTVASTLYANTYSNLPTASTSVAGIVQLTNDYTSTSQTTAPTSKALNDAINSIVPSGGGSTFDTFLESQVGSNLRNNTYFKDMLPTGVLTNTYSGIVHSMRQVQAYDINGEPLPGWYIICLEWNNNKTQIRGATYDENGNFVNAGQYYTINNSAYNNLYGQYLPTGPTLPTFLLDYTGTNSRLLTFNNEFGGFNWEPPYSESVLPTAYDVQSNVYINESYVAKRVLSNIETNTLQFYTKSSSITVDTITATTYNGLGSLPYLPLSGGSLSGAVDGTSIEMFDMTAQNFKIKSGTGQPYLAGITSNFETNVMDVYASGGVGAKINQVINNSTVGSWDDGGLTLVSGGGNTTMRLESGASQQSRINFGDSTTNARGRIHYSNSSNNMNFHVNNNNTPALTITANGNVGIGTTTPQDKVQINNSTNGTGLIISAGNNSSGHGGAVGFGISEFPTYTPMSSIKGTLNAVQGFGELQGGMAFLTRPFGFTTQALTERMRINLDGNVGIGTTAPSTKLEINAALTPLGAIIMNKPNSIALDGQRFLGFQTKNFLKWNIGINEDETGVGNGGNILSIYSYNNTGTFIRDVMNLTRDGNIGIGTNAPARQLTLYNGPSEQRNIQFLIQNDRTVNDSGANAGMRLQSLRDCTIACVNPTTNVGTIDFQRNTDFALRGRILYSHPTDSLRFTTAGVERMVLNSNGDLEINRTGQTTDFSLKLSETSTGKYIGFIPWVAGDTSYLNCVQNGDTVITSMPANSSPLSIGCGGNTGGCMRFTNTTNQVHIPTSRLGIGLTNPNRNLEVAQAVRVRSLNTTDLAVFELQNSANNLSQIIQYNNGTMGIFPANVGLGLNKAPGTSMELDLATDNARKLTTAQWLTGSDLRIKDNIEVADYDLCYENVKQLDLKRFKWNEEKLPKVDDRNVLGFIAQEVEQIYPNAVITTSEEFADGTTIEDFKNLQTDQIFKMMYGALKKAMNMIDTQVAGSTALEALCVSQKEQIDAQKAQIEALEATKITQQNTINNILERLEALENK